ncbi:hypothetical protein B9Z55_003300 [Caenorhabditis nigoni]|uniref:F-box domain-containing protein n=1 Tax=Caenorhabditis nigoni TaxID=1611254 RepID=A0A2G5VPM1_9PELO|nr:hypothetical protein B9Z55_003300 [Caenorhabditis nigoni]
MKLHRMPYVVQKMIVAELDLDERMLLSFTSKQTCRLLGISKLYTPPYLSITVRSYGVEVYIDHEDKWTFSIPYNKSDLENVVHWKIDGSNVLVSHEVEDIEDQEIKEHTVSIVEGAGFKRTSKLLDPLGKLLRHLSSFLDFKFPKIICHTLPNGLIPQLDFSIVLTMLNYGGPYEFKENRAAVVTPKELEVLLSKIKITWDLNLNVKVASAAYKYRKHPESIGRPLIEKLILKNHSWVDFSELPAARIISFTLKPQSHEINTMLRSWVAGKNRETEIVDFEIDKFTDRTRNFLFTGITQHETQLTEYRERFLKSEFSFDSLSDVFAVDIVRASDGMRATVIGAMLQPHRDNRWAPWPDSKRMMFVVVWSERNLRRGENDPWF